MCWAHEADTGHTTGMSKNYLRHHDIYQHCTCIENMLPLRWFYPLVNAHLCVLKLDASTYIHEPHSIVTSATLAAAVRPEGRIIVGCAVYA